ncbi:hypothetical protein K458DRAFT_447354 [Lentithecium fluviatile CBS 122367]|uniref:Peptidase S1 domain-containing protein n=1 Tax=Lentithecium fluviatile CBS 122367 TaxID=1168545 RepID=A0A6G1IFL9_9PLEO|nr:hypothetical protein K458DRAFT_447354 [Lentithecium fluviatile CBS 122367]
MDNGLFTGAPLVANDTSYQVSTITCGISFAGANTIFALTSAHAFEDNGSRENDKLALSHDDSTTGSGSQESDEASDLSFSSTDNEYDWDKLEVEIARERQETGLSDLNEPSHWKHDGKEGHTGHSEIKPGRVWGRRNNPEWENLDWALVEIPSLDQRSLLSWPSDEGSLIEPSCPSKAVGTVFVATASGLLEGTLSSIPSYLASSRNSTAWTKIWTLTLADQDQKRLHKGDSGSPVLNPQKNRVYGYVTALNPFGELHVMPLQAVLNQIWEMARPPNPSSKPIIFDKCRNVAHRTLAPALARRASRGAGQ